ncbi:isochorismatase family protein [Microbispora cellulosiformans]|uniref:Isochorismatase family protein n=1 Tax=Microbispora cellulosiformans TaxID=2614688 RepID=A0A5J5K593_9ACTN|nr:isochorismatase family protein [Microbispora cellulosiformans]KAA9378230.1 isochorismatase family protein [Microbispora cellulosiformans]
MTAAQTQQAHGLGNRDLLDQYLAAGFAGRVGWGERVALLVIDMAGAWTSQDEMIGANLDGVLRNVRRLLDVVRTRDDIPVVFTTMAYDETYSDLPFPSRLKTPHLERMIRGSERVRLVPGLDRRPHEALIEKPRASAFFNTNLPSILAAQRVDTVVVVGCSTSGCVRSTCESAIDHGLRAIVPAEAVGDRSASAHEAALFDINARYADVLSVEEVVGHIERLPRTAGAVTTDA